MKTCRKCGTTKFKKKWQGTNFCSAECWGITKQRKKFDSPQNGFVDWLKKYRKENKDKYTIII